MKRNKVKASDLPEFGLAEYLDSDEAVAEYLTASPVEIEDTLSQPRATRSDITVGVLRSRLCCPDDKCKHVGEPELQDKDH